MNYLHEGRLEPLAQRYVSGVMSYRARRRFQEILKNNPTAMDAVLAWEELLAPMALCLKPVRPSELVWQRIAREIGAGKSATAERRARPMLAAAMVLLFAGFLFTVNGWWQAANKPPEKIVERIVEVITQPVPESAIVSVMGVAEEPLWVARIYPRAKQLQIAVNTPPEEHTDKDYELWTLTSDGTPVSLGLLPKTGTTTVALNDQRLAAIADSAMLAVSLEPLGGSPEAVPTGPVMYTAQLLLPN